MTQLTGKDETMTSGTKALCHGWSTKKTENGYEWKVTATSGDHPNLEITTLKHGTEQTRARAAGMCRKWVKYFRRIG